jgi:hypothetical protein
LAGTPQPALRCGRDNGQRGVHKPEYHSEWECRSRGSSERLRLPREESHDFQSWVDVKGYRPCEDGPTSLGAAWSPDWSWYTSAITHGHSQRVSLAGCELSTLHTRHHVLSRLERGSQYVSVLCVASRSAYSPGRVRLCEFRSCV